MSWKIFAISCRWSGRRPRRMACRIGPAASTESSATSSQACHASPKERSEAMGSATSKPGGRPASSGRSRRRAPAKLCSVWTEADSRFSRAARQRSASPPPAPSTDRRSSPFADALAELGGGGLGEGDGGDLLDLGAARGDQRDDPRDERGRLAGARAGLGRRGWRPARPRCGRGRPGRPGAHPAVMVRPPRPLSARCTAPSRARNACAPTGARGWTDRCDRSRSRCSSPARDSPGFPGFAGTTPRRMPETIIAATSANRRSTSCSATGFISNRPRALMNQYPPIISVAPG